MPSSEGRLPSEMAVEARTIAKGGTIQIAGQFTSRILTLAFVAVATRILGGAGFGLYRQVFQILNISGSLAPGGFNFAAVRFIAQARALKDHGSVRGTARVALAGAISIGGVLAVGIFVAADPLAGAFADSGPSRIELAGLLRIGAAFIPLFSVMQVLRFCTQAYKTMVPSAIINNVILPVARFALGTTLLLLGFGVAGAVTSLVAATGLAMVAGIYYYRRMLTSEERAATPKAQIGPIVRFALPQAGVSIFSVQSLGLGVILLGLLSGDRDVGVFAVALSIQGAGSVFLTGVVAIWAPVVTDLYERGEIAQLASLYKTVNRWVATLSFPVFAAIIIEPDLFARMLAGRLGADAAVLAAVLAAGNLFFVGTGPSSHVLSMTGRPGVNLANSVAAVVLYVGLGVLLVPRYGALGMAAIDAAVTALVNIARVIEGRIFVGIQPFGRSFVKPVLATLAGGAVLLSSKAVLENTFALEILGLALAGSTYIGVLKVMGLDAEERHVFEQMRRRVLRRRRGRYP